MATVIEPTQVGQPGRTTARTVVQTILGVLLSLGVVVPAVVGIVGDQWAPWLGPQALTILGVAAAVAAAISGTLARIMAIPAVNAWLGAVGLGVTGWVTTDQVIPQHGLDADGDGHPDTTTAN